MGNNNMNKDNISNKNTNNHYHPIINNSYLNSPVKRDI